MRHIHSALLLAAAVSSLVAAQSTTSYPNPEQAIPTDGSPGCTNAITELNSDSDIKTCTDPLVEAVTNYAQATKAAGTAAAGNENALTTALNALCAPGAGCQTGLMKGKLKTFSDACLGDMVAQKTDIIDVYDKLYLIVPFQQALCSKDSSGNFCVTSLASSGAVGNGTASRRSLDEDTHPLEEARQLIEDLVNEKRQTTAATSGSSGDIVDEPTSSLAANNLPFLFVQPTSPKTILCGECTQRILAAYISFETSSPYAIGLQNSDILKTQSTLYKAGKAQCGADWATGVNKFAGTTAFAEVSAAPRRPQSSLLAAAATSAAVCLAAFFL